MFAKWIDLPALHIVLGRCAFAALALLIYCQVCKISLSVSHHYRKRLLITGVLLAAHWWSFFQTIQLTSVSLGLLSFACFPLFIPLLERLVDKTPLRPALFIQALLCFAGIYLILPSTPIESLHNHWLIGIGLGLFSAASFALVTFYNRRFVQRSSPVVINFYQQATAALLLSPWLFMYQVDINTETVTMLLILGIFFTALTHSIITYCLRFIPAFTVSLAFTLEPVYGILAAYWLLQEPLTTTTIIGAMLIVMVCAYVAAKQQLSSKA